MDSITLSGKEFKALASDTRTGIVKILQERNFTLSELSKKMNLAAPTVKQHLGVLEQAGLVQQLDEGRKWKYYSLTRKSKGMFDLEKEKSILIVLAANFIVLAGALYYFTNLFFKQAQEFAGRTLSDNLPKAGNAVQATIGEAPKIQETIIATQPVPIPIETIILLIAIIVILSLMLGFFIAKARKS